MKEPLLLKKPPLKGNARAWHRGYEQKMRVSQFWIHKESISHDEFIVASARNVLVIRAYSHFGK